MNKPVSSIMLSYLSKVARAEPIEKVERIFRLYKHPFAAVMDEDGDFFGLIPAATMMRIQLARSHIGDLTAGEICTQNVSAVGQEVSIREACDLLLRKNADYLVVLDESRDASRILGILTPQLLLKEALHKLDPESPRHPADKGFFVGFF